MPAPSQQLATLAGSWTLNPGRSSVRLTSKALGLIPVRGEFRAVSGTGTIGPDGAVRGTLTVATASIDTKNAKRDTHLRSADLFDSDQYPDITFVVENVRLAGQDAVVTGALTVRGVTRPLTFDAAVSIRGDGEIGLDAAVRINRADFGLTWNVLGTASMLSTITIQATFTPGNADE
jgi:polyisoprenoid-binding protein YceI